MGGLSKKAYQFEQIAKSQDGQVLTLDAGNLLFKKSQLSPKLVDQEKATAFAIVKSYNLMGYDAVGITTLDLIAGMNFFKQIDQVSNFPWLSANLVDAANKEKLFPESIVLEKGDLKIGVFALTSPRISKSIEEKEGIKALPWQDVLPKLVREISNKVDILILLSNLTEKENKEIAASHSEINIIIQAGVGTRNMAPKQQNNTLICQTGKQGKHIGIMNINWQGPAWGSLKKEKLKKKQLALDRIIWQLGKYKKKYSNPIEELKDKPNQLRTYRTLNAQNRTLSKEIAALKKEVEEGPEEVRPSTYKNRFIDMKTNLPDQPAVREVVDQLNEEIEQLGKKKKPNSQVKTSNYVGSERCGTCHNYQAASWRKSRHAKAYKTLVDNKKQFNLTCLPCHITGSGDIDQQEAASLADNLKAVGCENCHGPGKKHILKPAENKLPSRPPIKTCLTCHTEDHDDSFIYERDVDKLDCIAK